MKNVSLLEAWEHGHPMLNALLSLANEDERAAILKDEPNIFWGIAQIMAEAKLLADSQGIGFSEAVAIQTEKSKTDAELRNRVVSRIFDRIMSDHLVVVGFESPRKMASVAIEIPVEYLRQIIDWKKNEVRYESLRFVDVRVVAKSNILLQESNADPAANAGRKSREQIYFACFAALENQGQLDPTKSIKYAFPDIRAWLTREYPETFPTKDVGSDKTIYRYFKEFRNSPKVRGEPKRLTPNSLNLTEN